MAWMILLTILAAFAGGAVSTFFAEWLKGQFLNGKERQRILLFLSKEIESWIQNMQDICEGIIVNEGFGVWEGEAIASTLIEIPSLEKFIESHLFNKENDINLRDKALRLFRAINLYNAKYKYAIERQVSDHGTGVRLRKEAGTYAIDEVLERMKRLLLMVNNHYLK